MTQPLAATRMLLEICETPQVVEGPMRDGADEMRAAALAIGRFRPSVAAVVGRGTSDNAGTYARYLLELALGVPVALAAASLTTLYRSPTRWGGVLVIALSQSGASPDVVGSHVRRARAAQ
jgi:glucosamine--fructose-6-phosphate aminotransferase (isomerizing)